MFVFGAVLLGLIACAVVLWPVLARRRPTPTIEHDQFMRDLYRDRVEELGGENTNPELLPEMQEELGAVLLAEHAVSTSPAPSISATATNGNRAVLVVLAAATLAIGYGLYWLVADRSQLDVQGAEAVMTLDAQTERATIESWSRRLETRVNEQSDDAKSWYLLGHALLKLGAFQRSAEAFAATHGLVAEDLMVQMYWLQARYLAAQGKLDEVSKKIAEDILVKDPSNASVLEILALDAFQSGEPASAIRQLNRALQGTRDMSRQASLATALRQARSLLDPAPGGIEVEVTASASQPVPKSATIFVIARPIGGGMPYAVVKRPAIMVPFTVTVDDLVSMSDARTLSGADKFEIAVRLSHAGVAAAHPGDWLWLSPPLETAALGHMEKLVAQIGPPVTPNE